MLAMLIMVTMIDVNFIFAGGRGWVEVIRVGVI